MSQVKITLKRSLIGRPQNQRDTVKALGLVKENNPAIQGMIKTVSHLVSVEEV